MSFGKELLESADNLDDDILGEMGGLPESQNTSQVTTSPDGLATDGDQGTENPGTLPPLQEGEQQNQQQNQEEEPQRQQQEESAPQAETETPQQDSNPPQTEEKEELDSNLFNLSLLDEGADTNQQLVQPPTQQLQTPVDMAPFYGEISKELGVEIKNQESLLSTFKEFKQAKSLIESFGINDQVIKAVQDGIITREEVLAGNLGGQYGEGLTNDDMVSDALYDANPEMSQEELREQLAEMSAPHKAMFAAQYKQQINLQRQMAIQGIQSKIRLQNQKKTSEANTIIQQKELASQKLVESISKMETISGTDVTVDAQMKNQIAKVATNTEFMRKLMWGPGKDPDPEYAAHQIARLMYASQIGKVSHTKGKNEAKKELIKSTQNLDRSANTQGHAQNNQNPREARNRAALQLADETFGQ